MRREEKSDLISALQSSLKEADGVFVIENHGLTVKEMETLRNELRPLVSTFKVDAVDPTAAGDCFTGVLVMRYAETGDIIEAARYASAAAAISVQSLGAQPSLPMKDAIDAFYEKEK